MKKKTTEFVDDFLAHYSSQYYDPAKAHEYYLQNRELQNRRSTSLLTVKSTGRGKRGGLVTKVNKDATDRRKEAWAYAKNKIGDEKKANLENLSEERKQFVDRARKTTSAKREEIRDRLKNLLSALTNQRSEDSDTIKNNEKAALDKVEERRVAKARKIREDAQKQVDDIPAIPDGVVGPQRARLVAVRSKKIARIKGDAAREIGVITKEAATERETISDDADEKRKQLSSQTKDQKVSEREAASAKREHVAKQLKATVDKARADYEAGKKRLIAEYEAKNQQEFDAIRKRV